MDIRKMSKKYKEFLEEVSERDFDYLIDTYKAKKSYNEYQNLEQAYKDMEEVYQNREDGEYEKFQLIKELVVAHCG